MISATCPRKHAEDCQFLLKGSGLVIPHHVTSSSCDMRPSGPSIAATEGTRQHLCSMLDLLSANHHLKMAVRLEGLHMDRVRYLSVVSSSTAAEYCLLGFDCFADHTSIGLVRPLYLGTEFTLDGDGGLLLHCDGVTHLFKPVSIQAMWSTLQILHKCHYTRTSRSSRLSSCDSSVSRESHRSSWAADDCVSLTDSTTPADTSTHTHTPSPSDSVAPPTTTTCTPSGVWSQYSHSSLQSSQSCVNEWNALPGLTIARPPSPGSLNYSEISADEAELRATIRSSLREIMMSVDLDVVNSKQLRAILQQRVSRDLHALRWYVDQQALIIVGQLDVSSQILDYLYLGSEWNAFDLDQLIANRITHIINVTVEIDNFFPGRFVYTNVRVTDEEHVELLKYWDRTYRIIDKVREQGGRVLVHCRRGISRSASVVIAYVMKLYGWDYAAAYNYVHERRACVRPNAGFVKQLETYQGILQANQHRLHWLCRSKSESNLKCEQNTMSGYSTVQFSVSPSVDQTPPDSHNSEELLSLESLGSIFSNRPKSWSPSDKFLETSFQSDYADDIEFHKSEPPSPLSPLSSLQVLNDDLTVTPRSDSTVVTPSPATHTELAACTQVCVRDQTPGTESQQSHVHTPPAGVPSSCATTDGLHSARLVPCGGQEYSVCESHALNLSMTSESAANVPSEAEISQGVVDDHHSSSSQSAVVSAAGVVKRIAQEMESRTRDEAAAVGGRCGVQGANSTAAQASACVAPEDGCVRTLVDRFEQPVAVSSTGAPCASVASTTSAANSHSSTSCLTSVRADDEWTCRMDVFKLVERVALFAPTSYMQSYSARQRMSATMDSGGAHKLDTDNRTSSKQVG